MYIMLTKKIRNTDVKLQTTDVVAWLAQASCRFLRQVPTTYQKMREVTNIYIMRKEERGKLNIFVVSN